MPDHNEQLLYDMGLLTWICVLTFWIGKLILGLV